MIKAQYVPSVIEKTANGERAYDIFSRLVEDRIIYLWTQVTDMSSNLIIAQLLYLNKRDPKKDIVMYINTPGWDVFSWLAIYDTMQMISNDIVTICVGMAASMGSVILCGGTKGKRFILPHSEVMIHQPLSGVEWQASDIIIRADHINKTRKRLNKLIAYHSGKSLKQVEKDTDRDYWMDSEEAVKYGMVDKVIWDLSTWEKIQKIK